MQKVCVGPVVTFTVRCCISVSVTEAFYPYAVFTVVWRAVHIIFLCVGTLCQTSYAGGHFVYCVRK
jgi:hypothetical protein